MQLYQTILKGVIMIIVRDVFPLKFGTAKAAVVAWYHSLPPSLESGRGEIFTLVT
jgi:hypothetical protein